MRGKNLRSELIRLAHANPDLRADILPLVGKVAAADLVEETYDVVRNRWYKFYLAMNVVLEGQLKKFGVALKKMGYTLDLSRSYADWRQDSEGAYPDIKLVFEDTRARDTEQVGKDLKTLGIYGWPQEAGPMGVWKVRFGGK